MVNQQTVYLDDEIMAQIEREKEAQLKNGLKLSLSDIVRQALIAFFKGREPGC